VTFIVVLESLILIIAAFFLWSRTGVTEPRRGRDFAFVILALGLQFGLFLAAKANIEGFQGGENPSESLTPLALGVGAIQILRTLLLAWAVRSWLLAVRPRLVRSWRGVLILLCLIATTFVPDLTVVFGIMMVLPLWRLKWTAGVHGWGRVGLFVFLGLLAFVLFQASDTTTPDGELRHAVFDDDRSLTPLQADLQQPAAALVHLLRPWSHAIRVMLVLLHVQVIVGFLHLLLAPVRLRGLSLKRRFTVTLAMYRFIPGTLAFIFMVLIVYMGIGLHRATVARHTFERTLDEGMRTAEILLSSISPGTFSPDDAQQAIRSTDRWAMHPSDRAFAVIRQLGWTTVERDSTDDEVNAEQWVTRALVSSDDTPEAILSANFFTEIPGDSAIGLVQTDGSLYLRAARVHRADGRGTGAEVLVIVDSLYAARIADRIQSDVRIDVSPNFYLTSGSGMSINMGDEEDHADSEARWAESAFTVAAPFDEDSEHDNLWERTYYLARTYIPMGNWLVPLGENVRVGAIQLKLYTSPRGLFESLTSSAISAASQLFALALFVTIGLLFLIVELSAVRTGRGIIKGIVTDVKGLSEAARKFGEGNLQHRVALSGKDEMGQLASTFNTMAANIEEHQEVLLEKERLEADLSVARDIQQRMLPQSPPSIPGLDVAGLSIPSREVGGDLFYFLPVSNGRLGLTIGDVSGKSVPAALLMSNVLAALKAEARIVDNEDEILDHLNHLIVDQVEPGRLVTFFYGVVDPRNRMLRYACAGHNPPLIMRPSGEAEWLKEAGLPLGVMSESTYKPVEAALEPGDVLVLYSDGVTEAARATVAPQDDDSSPPDDDEFFDEHRLEAAVRDARDKSSAEIISHVMDAIRRFTAGAEQSDDLTLVVVRVAP
jgi:serine phosphatase RsbU (regulator of sigma subunit)